MEWMRIWHLTYLVTVVAASILSAINASVSHFCNHVRMEGTSGHLSSLPSAPLIGGKEAPCTCNMTTETDGYLRVTFMAAPNTEPESCLSPLLIHGPLGVETFTCAQAKLATLTLTLYQDQQIIFELQNLGLLHHQIYSLQYNFTTFPPLMEGEVRVACDQKPYSTLKPLTTQSTVPTTPEFDTQPPPAAVPLPQEADTPMDMTVVAAVIGAIGAAILLIFIILLLCYFYRRMKSRPVQQIVRPLQPIRSIKVINVPFREGASRESLTTTASTGFSVGEQIDASKNEEETVMPQTMDASQLFQYIERQASLTENSQTRHQACSSELEGESGKNCERNRRMEGEFTGYLRVSEISLTEMGVRTSELSPEYIENTSSEDNVPRKSNTEMEDRIVIVLNTERTTTEGRSTDGDRNLAGDDETAMNESIETTSTDSGIKSQLDLCGPKPIEQIWLTSTDTGNPDYVRVGYLDPNTTETCLESDCPYIRHVT